MPFGDFSKGEFGTYFIGYARSPHRIERMLQNMFIGDPPGNYDRLLDVSRAVTGTLFFVPSATFLDGVSPDSPSSEGRSSPPPDPSGSRSDGSLGIGSLKQEG
jgi:putative iron-dependent peroxidase